jgi:hypothetical protein
MRAATLGRACAGRAVVLLAPIEEDGADTGRRRRIPALSAGPAGIYASRLPIWRPAGRRHSAAGHRVWWLYARCGLLLSATPTPSLAAARSCAQALAALNVPTTQWTEPDPHTARAAAHALTEGERHRIFDVLRTFAACDDCAAATDGNGWLCPACTAAWPG